MFEKLRQSLRDTLASAPAGDRREAVSRMRDTLALARVGLDDLRRGVDETRARHSAEQRELETVRRRRALAAGIGDTETVAVAERFERHHTERAEVLARKLAAQERELALAEQEVAEMGEELRAAMRGGPTARGVNASTGGATPPGDDADADAGLQAELDAVGRARARAAREAAADERLADLKRRAGK